MKQLEKTFISGEAGYSANPRTYRQVRRNDKVAIYERSFGGRIEGFEVFKIKILKQGTRVFNKITEEDEEQYAHTTSFGQSAWFVVSLDRANELFEKIGDDKAKGESDERRPLNEDPRIPPNNFTIKFFAEYNKIPYLNAFLIVKDFLIKGKIKKIGKEKTGQRGKLSQTFSIV